MCKLELTLNNPSLKLVFEGFYRLVHIHMELRSNKLRHATGPVHVPSLMSSLLCVFNQLSSMLNLLIPSFLQFGQYDSERVQNMNAFCCFASTWCCIYHLTVLQIICRSPIELTRMISDLQKSQLSMMEKQGDLQARYFPFLLNKYNALF